MRFEPGTTEEQVIEGEFERWLVEVVADDEDLAGLDPSVLRQMFDASDFPDAALFDLAREAYEWRREQTRFD